MLDRETFKERLQIITDYYDMVDRVSVASNNAIQLFEINEVENVVGSYINLLKRDMNDDVEFSGIDWWLEEYIMHGDEFKPCVVIDDKDVIINTPDKLYTYLKEYSNVD